ncbi:hypothetical protein FPV67DRAFT_1139489 [Lyophyllum atratum]|nr:hypothetical protein FPV67DRAFT_1139489 [Lyophyllum atratum]
MLLQSDPRLSGARRLFASSRGLGFLPDKGNIDTTCIVQIYRSSVKTRANRSWNGDEHGEKKDGRDTQLKTRVEKTLEQCSSSTYESLTSFNRLELGCESIPIEPKKVSRVSSYCRSYLLTKSEGRGNLHHATCNRKNYNHLVLSLPPTASLTQVVRPQHGVDIDKDISEHEATTPLTWEMNKWWR